VNLDNQVQAYLKAIREHGGAVNTSLTIAIGTGIAMRDSKFASIHCNDNFELSKDWAKYLMQRMGLVQRRTSTKAKVDVKDFEEIKKRFLLDVRNVMEMDEIPADLVINFDQTAVHYVPVDNWMMAKEGSKRAEIIGKDDKCQITEVLGGTMSGDFLPVQLVYQGTTNCCLPSFKFPDDWDITYSYNHWCNETTMLDYMHKILFPYCAKKRSELALPPDYRALVLFDNFNGQCTEEILTLLDNNNINAIIIPANCTDKLQPLDLTVNKPVKDFLRREFRDWYAKQVWSQLDEDRIELIDLRLTTIKPLGAQWMTNAFDYIKSKPDIIKNGFSSAGISQ